jgi:hypothetical protein
LQTLEQLELPMHGRDGKDHKGSARSNSRSKPEPDEMNAHFASLQAHRQPS